MEKHTFQLAIIAVIVIFMIDIAPHPDYAIWLLYAVPVFFASQKIVTKKIIFLALLCPVLVIAEFIFVYSGAQPQIDFSNRLMGIGVFWMITFLLIQNKNSLDRIRQSHAILEYKVRERTAKLENLNRDLESFSYSISHDLRMPLQFIHGLADMISEDHGQALGEEGRKKLKMIGDNIDQMDRLVLGILALSRSERQDLKCDYLDMTAIAQSVIEEITRAADLKRQPEFKLHDLPSARGDPVLIRQVFANLLSNAFKFTRYRDYPEIEVAGSSNSESIYWVRDNGAGFDVQNSETLFGLFQRFHDESQFEGTGVGLAIVQRIIHRHGGRVWAESKVNEGATFYFSMPTVEKLLASFGA